MVLTGSGMPASSGAIYLKGNVPTATGIPFGDGLRSADGTLIRLGFEQNVNGCSYYPAPGDPSVSVRGGKAVGSGHLAVYQVDYRNAAAFCTPVTFNPSNAERLVW